MSSSFAPPIHAIAPLTRYGREALSWIGWVANALAWTLHEDGEDARASVRGRRRTRADWDDDAARDDNPFADFTAGDDYHAWLGSWAH